SLGNPVGSAVTMDVLANDTAAVGRTLDPASVQIAGTVNPGDSLVVTGQGTWSVTTATGAITFTPEEALVGSPTPITYTMADDQGNASNAATVTVIYTEPPVANDDASLGNPVGGVVIVDVLANDTAAASRTLDPASVQISGTTSPGESLVIVGQGTWSVNITTGAIMFTPEEALAGSPTAIEYTVDDDQGNVSNAAIVTVTYTESPVANDDASLGNPVGNAATVDVLLNDTAAVSRTLNPASVQITGTANPGDSLVVLGEGTWSVNTTTGAITFTPEAGFEGNPTPIMYTVADDQGNTSDPAIVTITYTENPLARNDVSLGNAIGSVVTVDVLVNDVTAPGRTLDPTSVVIVGASGDGKELVVPGEGTWTVNTTTGATTFTPEEGFTGNPTPITYTVNDDQGNASNAATVTVIYTEPPVAVVDSSTDNPVGSAVTVDVLANDTAAVGRTLDPASVQFTGTANPGDSLVVTGQGTWSVNTTTGAITFTPEEGFTGNPTPIMYTMTDDQGNASNAATVTVTYTEPPVANDDESTGNAIGSVVNVDVLTNDTVAVGRTLDPASVQIAGTANPGESLVVMGQGTWSVITVTGAIAFTPEEGFTGNPTPIIYTMADDQGNVSNVATVTVAYTEPPMANDDESLGNPVGSAVTVNVLANDTAAVSRTLDPASVQIMGTANPGDNLVVGGQGVWSVNSITGAITFTPEAGFAADPAPIAYTVGDNQGNTSNPATVTITYADKVFFVYLPLTVRYWPPIPAAPVLNTINNPEGDGNYTVSWNSTEFATSYVLQESNTNSFSDAVQVYSDTDTTVSLSDRGPTRYYYRVQARNSYANSAWSNVRSVDVLWEKEPNDDALTQANGPLISGLTYYGRFSSGEDQKDYFFVHLQSAQSVELWLSNIAAAQDYDLTLRNAALQVVAHSGELGNANEYIRTATLPAGWYYIQVYNRSGNGSTQPYHLRVVYPTVVLTALGGDIPMSMPRSSNPPPTP
ncbi:MAG: Ig-like domain-containing protein, partial [Anaerolineae bacterium]